MKDEWETEKLSLGELPMGQYHPADEPWGEPSDPLLPWLHDHPEAVYDLNERISRSPAEWYGKEATISPHHYDYDAETDEDWNRRFTWPITAETWAI